MATKKVSPAAKAARQAFKARALMAKKIWDEEMKGKKGKKFTDAVKEAAKRMKKK